MRVMAHISTTGPAVHMSSAGSEPTRLQTYHGLERLRLRGLSGARDEFHLAAIVQNLKTLAPSAHPPTTPAARLRVRVGSRTLLALTDGSRRCTIPSAAEGIA